MGQGNGSVTNLQSCAAMLETVSEAMLSHAISALRHIKRHAQSPKHPALIPVMRGPFMIRDRLSEPNIRAHSLEILPKGTKLKANKRTEATRRRDSRQGMKSKIISI